VNVKFACVLACANLVLRAHVYSCHDVINDIRMRFRD